MRATLTRPRVAPTASGTGSRIPPRKGWRGSSHYPQPRQGFSAAFTQPRVLLSFAKPGAELGHTLHLPRSPREAPSAAGSAAEPWPTSPAAATDPPVVKPISAFSPPSKPVIHQALMGPNFLALTPPASEKKTALLVLSTQKSPRSSVPRFLRARLTIQTRVVVVDGLHGPAEVELDVPLDQAGVEGAQVASLVVDAGTGTEVGLCHPVPRGR